MKPKYRKSTSRVSAAGLSPALGAGAAGGALAGALVLAVANGGWVGEHDAAAPTTPGGPAAPADASGGGAGSAPLEPALAAALRALPGEIAPSGAGAPPSADPGGEPGETPAADSDGAANPAAEARAAAALAAWQGAEARIAALSARVASLERTLANRLAAAADSDRDRPVRPNTPDERRSTLVQAGVDPGLAEDILWRESRLELDRLALRDQAVREGWFNTERYRSEIRALSESDIPMRNEIGDGAWDRYLYLSGDNNRVQVSSVLPGSAAEAAGLQPGDLVEAYAGERVFAWSELRNATTAGESGELVQVRVRRGAGTFDAWVPRGPLGVRLDMTRVEPGP